MLHIMTFSAQSPSPLLPPSLLSRQFAEEEKKKEEAAANDAAHLSAQHCLFFLL
jgi:hypothetical protein